LGFGEKVNPLKIPKGTWLGEKVVQDRDRVTLSLSPRAAQKKEKTSP